MQGSKKSSFYKAVNATFNKNSQSENQSTPLKHTDPEYSLAENVCRFTAL